MYVVTGATGHTGRAVVEGLLKAGKAVRALGRTPEKLKALANEGADTERGDLKDPDFLADCFAGATAVYALLAPNIKADDLRRDQAEKGEALCTAIERARVKNVVFLSSLGAERSGGLGPVNGLHEQEERLRDLSGVNVLSLRAGYFMENVVPQIPGIKARGVIAGPARGSVKLPLIATKDIGAAACAALVKLDFQGFTVRELRGAADVSFDELVKVLGETIDKPELRYVQLQPDDAEKAFLAGGMSKSVARAFVELGRAIDRGIGINASGRTPASTTPTTIFEFAKAFKALYDAA